MVGLSGQLFGNVHGLADGRCLQKLAGGGNGYVAVVGFGADGKAGSLHMGNLAGYFQDINGVGGAGTFLQGFAH